jgi:hypothetical protein
VDTAVVMRRLLPLLADDAREQGPPIAAASQVQAPDPR